MAISVPSVSGEEAEVVEAEESLAAAASGVGEEEDEEEEPQLLYERLKGEGVAALLASDVLSVTALSGKHLALGTRGGVVAVLDTAGKLVRQFPPLRGAINDIGFDYDGAFVGAACEGGSVSVSAVVGDDRTVFNQSAAVKSVALDPGYSTKKSRQMAVGTAAGQLVLCTKGWMGARDHVIHSGEGPVRCVRWCGTLIAWANDSGVKLYDTGAHARVAHIGRPAGAPKPEAFPPRLAWQDDTTLIIGWADYIKVARVSVRGIRPEEAVDALEHGMDRGIGPVCVHVVDVVAAFQTDCFISGIAPLSPGRLVLLAYTPPDRATNRAPVPEVRVVTWTNTEVTADALALRGHDRCGPADLSLAWHTPPGAAAPAPLGGAATGPCFWAGEAPTFVLGSPRDLVQARPRDVAAHCAWLVSLGRFGQALDMCDAAEAAGVADAAAAAAAAGGAWIDALLARSSVASAAALCPRLLRGDATSWEATVYRFAAVGALPALAKHLPVAQPQLGQNIYEMVLAACVSSPSPDDHAALVAAVTTWPVALYAPQALAAALRGRIAQLAADLAAEAEDECVTGQLRGARTGDPRLLKEALAHVLLADGQVSAAVMLLLDLGAPAALPLMAHHRLLPAVAADRQLVALAAQDHEAVAPLLVEERAAVAPATVVQQLRVSTSPGAQRLLQRYLAELHQADGPSAAPFGGLAVELTGVWAPQSLMGLLASSTSYPLEVALQTAAQAGLVREQVFVLGRMGDARRALALILDAMGDVDQALEFVQAQGDTRLWDELIRRAGAAPQLAGALLERIGSSADARPLITALLPGARIERLRERLVKMLTDVRALSALWQGCAACLRADVVAGSRAMYGGAARAMRPSAVRWTDE